MTFTKTLFSILIFASLLGTPASITYAAGGVESTIKKEATLTIEKTVKIAEKTLEALNNGTDKKTTLKLLQKTELIAKGIKIAALNPLKTKASTQMEKARIAAQKNDLDTAKKHIAKGVEYYHELREIFYAL